MDIYFVSTLLLVFTVFFFTLNVKYLCPRRCVYFCQFVHIIFFHNKFLCNYSHLIFWQEFDTSVTYWLPINLCLMTLVIFCRYIYFFLYPWKLIPKKWNEITMIFTWNICELSFSWYLHDFHMKWLNINFLWKIHMKVTWRFDLPESHVNSTLNFIYSI